MLKRVAILFLVTTFHTACLPWSESSAYPTDDEMLYHFLTHRDHFESLMQQFRADADLLRVNQDGSALRDHLTEVTLDDAKREVYRDLLTRLGLFYISRIPDGPGSIYMQAWWSKSGTLIGGKSKYFAYTAKAGNDTVASLDEIFRTGRDANEFRHVTGNWYLYLDVW
jgi:hypothetical protein